MFCSFGHEACGILALLPGIEPAPSAVEGEVLTTGLPEKSPNFLFLKVFIYPSLLKGKFDGYNILGCCFFSLSFQHFISFTTAFLICIVFDEKSAMILILTPL